MAKFLFSLFVTLLPTRLAFASAESVFPAHVLPYLEFDNRVAEFASGELWMSGNLGFGLLVTMVLFCLLFANIAYVFRHGDTLPQGLRSHRKYTMVGVLLFVFSLWMVIYSYYPTTGIPYIFALVEGLPLVMFLLLFSALFLLGLPGVIHEGLLAGKIFSTASSSITRLSYFVFALLLILFLFHYIILAVVSLLNAYPSLPHMLVFNVVIPIILALDVFLILKKYPHETIEIKTSMNVLTLISLTCLTLFAFGFTIFFGFIAYLLQMYTMVELGKKFPKYSLQRSILYGYCYYFVIMLMSLAVLIHEITIPLLVG